MHAFSEVIAFFAFVDLAIILTESDTEWSAQSIYGTDSSSHDFVGPLEIG